MFSPLSAHDFLYAPHGAALQTDLDAMWMRGRLGQDLPDDSFGQFTRALILLEDDQHRHAGFDLRAGLSIHQVIFISNYSAGHALCVTCSKVNYGAGAVVGVSVGVGGKGVTVSVGVLMTGMDVSVGNAVGGISVGGRVGVGVGVGRLRLNVTRFSA